MSATHDTRDTRTTSEIEVSIDIALRQTCADVAELHRRRTTQPSVNPSKACVGDVAMQNGCISLFTPNGWCNKHALTTTSTPVTWPAGACYLGNVFQQRDGDELGALIMLTQQELSTICNTMYVSEVPVQLQRYLRDKQHSF
jgi:hypothetical protein